ncbi:MAG: response regulator [Syntrophomonadaceae bacterium]|jgi:two-component system response regulator (stage 0 sporulation protein F)
MKGNMLIVDDQKGVRRLLEELFKKDGWEVHMAADGREAIDQVDNFLPNIILMDMKMPNMNGLEASQKILEKHPGLTIIMMTAYGEMEVVKRALDAGVKKCVTKPFDIMNLRNIVNELVLYQEAL